MKIGDSVRDGQGRSYQVAQLLGRGAWGRTWLVRRETDDAHLVLKSPLEAGDLRPGASEALYALSREAVIEQARLYEQAQVPFLPRLQERVSLPDGAPGFLIARQTTSLERKLVEGLSLGTLVEHVMQATRLARSLDAVGGGLAGVHGDLRPTNILFDDRGQMLLTDVATPAARRMLARLPASEGVNPWLPPELEGASDTNWSHAADSWALSLCLWHEVAVGDGPAQWPRHGLDKTAQVALKDRLLERMKVEESNPRFHTRLAERLSVLLGRALSRDTMPSPPYRFHKADDFLGRVDEVLTLIRPRVVQIGKIMLERTPAKPWFTTDEDVSFTCTVGTTAGVEAHDEVGVGIAMFEIDRDQRVKDLDLGYAVDKHPTGRWRFAFQVGAMAPGRYRARIAFAVRESSEPPATVDAEFTVRAAPGWVPRAEPAPAPEPIVLHPGMALGADAGSRERDTGPRSAFPGPADGPQLVMPKLEAANQAILTIGGHGERRSGSGPVVVRPPRAAEPSSESGANVIPLAFPRAQDGQGPVPSSHATTPHERPTGPTPTFVEAEDAPSYSGPKPVFPRTAPPPHDSDRPSSSGPRPIPAAPRPPIALAPVEPTRVAAPPRPPAAPPPLLAAPLAPEPPWSGGPVTWGGDTPAHASLHATPPPAPTVSGGETRRRADAVVVEIERPRRPSASAGWFEMPLGPSARARDDESDTDDEEHDDATTVPAGPSTLHALQNHAMAALATVRNDPYVGIMAGFAVCILALILASFAR
jgi:hypothetical protein